MQRIGEWIQSRGTRGDTSQSGNSGEDSQDCMFRCWTLRGSPTLLIRCSARCHEMYSHPNVLGSTSILTGTRRGNDHE